MAALDPQESGVDEHKEVHEHVNTKIDYEDPVQDWYEIQQTTKESIRFLPFYTTPTGAGVAVELSKEFEGVPLTLEALRAVAKTSGAAKMMLDFFQTRDQDAAAPSDPIPPYVFERTESTESDAKSSSGDSSTSSARIQSKKMISSLDIDFRQILNPIIAMIGVGTYKEDVGVPSLPGVKNDYKNLMELLLGWYRYKFIYSTAVDSDNGEIGFTILDRKKLPKNDDGDNYIYPENMKLEWTKDEMIQFAQNISSHVEYPSDEEPPDGLIFIISGHGSLGAIADSNGKNCPINEITSFFLNKNNGCPSLANKPKILIVDACQGGVRPYVDQPEKGYDKERKRLENERNAKRAAANDKVDDKNDNDDDGDDDDDSDDSDGDDNDEDDPWVVQDYHYLSNQEWFCLYANVKNYAVPVTEKGGYLTRALTTVLQSRSAALRNFQENSSLIRKEVQALVELEKNNTMKQIVRCEECVSFQIFLARLKPMSKKKKKKK